MHYYRITHSLEDRGVLIPENTNVWDVIKRDSDHYISCFKYNEEQKKQFDVKGTISGITDVVANKIWWDFDSELDPSKAKNDVFRLVNALTRKGMPPEAILVWYSGSKGFSVEINVEESLAPFQVRTIATSMAEKLETFDTKVYNAARIFRIPNTRHQKTNLFKTPLKMDDLYLSMDQIKVKAMLGANDIDGKKIKASDYFTLEKKEEKTVVAPGEDIDFSKKAKGWTNCKWSLLNGNFGSGDRHYSTLAIIATCKNLNYPKEAAYYMAKSACKLAVIKNSGDEFEKEEIWKNVESVYGGSWNGGTFSCKDGKSSWLTNICTDLGHNKCKKTADKTNFVEVENVFQDFSVFAKDIDKNTIKTGISKLDKNVRLRTGQMVGILGSPSSGKTALALELLENTSRQGLLSVFYSLDMSSSELFQKIAQRVTGFEETYLYKTLQTDPIVSEEIKKAVCEAYTNVKFCFDTGISAEHIENSILEFEEQTNKKVKLLLLDYNELLSSPFSDATASSGHNAGALKKLTNMLQLCTISLLQPPKIVGDASDEIYSYRNVKGSSLLEQCFSTIIGIYRPGFSPKNDSENDRYLVMNVLKNRLGKLTTMNFNWEGLRGKITEANEDDDEQIKDLAQKKREEKSKASFF